MGNKPGPDWGIKLDLDNRRAQPLPKLGPYEGSLLEYLVNDATKPSREQRTAVVLFEELQRRGFEGGYDSVRRYVQKWRRSEVGKKVTAYIPQTFAPGKRSSSTGATSRSSLEVLLLS